MTQAIVIFYLHVRVKTRSVRCKAATFKTPGELRDLLIVAP